jgi:hypothetical protein
MWVFEDNRSTIANNMSCCFTRTRKTQLTCMQATLTTASVRLRTVVTVRCRFVRVYRLTQYLTHRAHRKCTFPVQLRSCVQYRALHWQSLLDRFPGPHMSPNWLPCPSVPFPIHDTHKHTHTSTLWDLDYNITIVQWFILAEFTWFFDLWLMWHLILEIKFHGPKMHSSSFLSCSKSTRCRDNLSYYDQPVVSSWVPVQCQK